MLYLRTALLLFLIEDIPMCQKFNIEMIKQLTSNTSYFIVCEATCFGPYVTIIKPSYESSQ